MKLLTGGLADRNTRLQQVGEDLREAVEDADRNAVAFSALAAREAVTGPQRRAAAAAAVAEQRAREKELQARYKALHDQLADLRRGAAGPVQQPIAV